ncbi:MAG: pstB [Acidobacteria bacterium]|nr:pstB [Acidobacteriota bacterium]
MSDDQMSPQVGSAAPGAGGIRPPERLMAVGAARRNGPPSDQAAGSAIFDVAGLKVFYGSFQAVAETTMQIREHEITALIGPSGCGKTTVLRCFNRMNDLIETARVEGVVRYHGVDIYGEKVDPVEVRPSRSRSTTTSPSGPASPASRVTWTTWWKSRCNAPPFGTRSRTS